MARLVGREQRQQEGAPSPEHDGSLPLRWAVIIVVALGSGFAVGSLVNLVAGITVGLGVAGTLHRILAKR